MRIAFRKEGDIIIRVWMLRRNKTVKKVKIREKKDSFIFEDGKYFVKPDKVLLLKTLFGFRPFLFYKEGIAEPLSADNIQLIHEGKIYDPTDENDKTGKETILIDAQSIHNLTSRDLLSVLVKSTLSRMEVITLILLILNIIISLGAYA